MSGDFDGDGNADLVFRDRGNGDSTVMLMVGGKPRDKYIVRRLAAEQAVAAADLNGDGYEDLVMLDSTIGKITAWLMKAGKIVEIGDDVFSHPQHPYTRELLHAASVNARIADIAAG